MKKLIVIILSVQLFLSGCATAPRNISASYVSPMQYNSYSCEQIQAEMLRVSSKIREVAGVQQSKANSDAWATGIGLVLFWPALFFLIGGDKKEELSRLKGEYEALEQAAIQKNCGFMADVQKAREEEALKAQEKKTKQVDKATDVKQNF